MWELDASLPLPYIPHSDGWAAEVEYRPRAGSLACGLHRRLVSTRMWKEGQGAGGNLEMSRVFALACVVSS